MRLRVVLAKKPVEDVGGMSPVSTGLAEDDRIINGICIKRLEHKTNQVKSTEINAPLYCERMRS